MPRKLTLSNQAALDATLADALKAQKQKAAEFTENAAKTNAMLEQKRKENKELEAAHAATMDIIKSKRKDGGRKKSQRKKKQLKRKTGKNGFLKFK